MGNDYRFNDAEWGTPLTARELEELTAGMRREVRWVYRPDGTRRRELVWVKVKRNNNEE